MLLCPAVTLMDKTKTKTKTKTINKMSEMTLWQNLFFLINVEHLDEKPEKASPNLKISEFDALTWILPMYSRRRWTKQKQ